MAQLIKTPHPVTLEGQEHIAVGLRPGESLYSLLNRTLGDQLDNERWNISVAGVEVPMEKWHDCYPKDGQVIECVGDMGRSALMMVAVIALTIWTGGMFAAVAAGGGIAGLGTVASYAVIAGIQVAGSLLINKVLGPKPPGSPDNTQGPTAHSLNSTQNQPRPHGAVGLLFGRVRYAPDLASQIYNYFDHDDMYMAMHLAWGIGVGRVEELRNGDTLLSDFDDAVEQWNAGFLAMPNQTIPLFGNTDSQPGGSLQQEKVPMDVTRTTSVDTVRIMVNISGSLYGVTRKGKLSMNQETFSVSYRKAGATAWENTILRPMRNDDRRTLRFTMTLDVPEGQYDVLVKRLGMQSTGDGDVCEFSFDTMVSVQKDTSDYRGIARTGFTMRANERLSSQPTAVNGFAVAAPIPVWHVDRGWVTEETSNPGAHILKYLRGYYDAYGNLIAGVGLTDEDIDMEALKSFMVHCREKGFGYDYWLNSEREHLEVLNSIAQAGMGQFTDANGLMSVSWVSEDQPIDGTVNMARIKKGTFRVDYSLIGTADGVECRYWDTEKNKEALLRVPMPGVVTMLNPAKMTLEGVTSEAQAAFLARYHLAQSLYQFKDVSFGTGLENLTYRRLSLLQMQHDLTQWGYGGTVLEATAVGNRLQLTLDEKVPAPAGGRQGYIGVRVPGQRAAAIFKVQPFTGETNVITLAEPWPSDLAVPGNTSGNPAHDSIWIYDFKETPGLTVRVVSISRAVDRSANVSVVVESAQFWTYVRTGHYEPAESGSLLQTRPVVSALKVVDQQQVIGDVVQDQLVVSFDVSGPYDESVIYTTEVDGSLRERARTRSRNAEFNIPGPGTYTITVVPFNRQGLQGRPVSTVYTTQNAGLPPVLVDQFDVEDAPGGIRRYVWGFLPQTIQSPDFAGVEIRYIAGVNQHPEWANMAPVGEGFFVSSQELVLPPSGLWTFACRSRNTSGVLSTDMKVVSKQLKANTGEVIGGIEGSVGGVKEDLAKEINDRINGQLEVGEKAAADLAAKSQELQTQLDANARAIGETASELSQTASDLKATSDALGQEVIDRVNGDLNTELVLTTKITTETQQRENDVENLTRMISSISAGSGQQFDQFRSWMFDTSVEGWGSNGGAATMEDGWMRPANNSASYAQSPAGLGVNGNTYRYMKMRVKRVGAPVWNGLLRWTTDADTAWDDAKSVRIPAPQFNAAGIAVVDFDDIPWNGPSPIRQVRLALTTVQNATSYIMYDWVAIGRPAPGASVAMVQEEAAARIAADSAEATKRESLGVQMRGDYEGGDVAGVKSGLVASERDARITGDQVNATAIQVVQARMPAGDGKLATESRVDSLQQATTDADKALGQRIDTITVNLDSKADVSLVNALRGDVNRIDNTVKAQATQLTQLDVNLRAVTVQGSSFVINGSFEQGRDVGWDWSMGTSWATVNEGRNGGACSKKTGNPLPQRVNANGKAVIPVVPGKTYRYSCYYRTSDDFNGSGGNSKLRIGNQTDALLGPTTIFVKGKSAWTYLEGLYTVPVDGPTTGLQLSFVADNTAGTIWVDDVAMDEVTDYLANASAVQGLTTTVNQLKDGTTANAEAVTKLTAGLGNATAFTIVANAGLGSPTSSGAPRETGIYNAAGTRVSGANRGFRCVVVNPDNTLVTAVGFDTYGEAATNAGRFNAWYDDVLQDNQWFILYTSDATGNIGGGTHSNVAGMRERLMDAGLSKQNIPATGFPMTVLVGRKKLGAGAGLQQVARPDPVTPGTREGLFAMMGVQFVQGIPQGTLDVSRLDTAVQVNATAVQGLTVEVSDLGGKFNAQATQLTQLRTDVNDVTSKTAANTTAVQQLSTRTTAVEGKVDTAATNVTRLQSQMGSVLSGDDSLFPYGTFEYGIDGQLYTTAAGGNTFTYRASAARTGRLGLAIETVAAQGSNADAYFGEYTPVSAERRIYVEYWARLREDSATPTSGQLTVGFQTQNRLGGSSNWPGLGRSLVSLAQAKGEWVKNSGYLVTNAAAERWRLWISIPNNGRQGGMKIDLDDIRMIDVTDAYNAQQATDANATAVEGLTTRVSQAEGKVDAQAGQMVDLNSSILATLYRGDSLVQNPTFDYGIQFWLPGNLNGGSTVTHVTGGGQQGNALMITRPASATASPFVFSNQGRWTPIKLGQKNRRVRVTYVARALDGNMQVTTRLRVRDQTGEGNADQHTTITTAWARQTLVFNVGDTRNEVMLQLWTPTVGRLLFDRIECFDITEELAIDANATATSDLSTQVTQQGTKLDATAQDVTNLKTQVGDVNATAFNQLKTQVSQQGTKLDATATQVSGLQVKVDGKAEASVVQTMQATIRNQGEGGNLIPNSTFPNWSGSGWGQVGTWANWGNSSNDTNYIPHGFRTALSTVRSAAVVDNNWGIMVNNVPAIAGKTYCIAAGINTHRCGVLFYAEFMNGAGAIIGSVSCPEVVNTNRTAGPLNEFPRYFGIQKAPPGTAFMRVAIRLRGLGEAWPYMWLWQPMLCEVAEGATQPPPFAVSGQQAEAQWAVDVRADGKVGGVKLGVTGQQAVFDIVADRFRVSPAGGGARTEYSDGNWRVYDGANRLRARFGVWP